MSKRKNRRKKNGQHLPMRIIMQAVNGEPSALRYIVRYYDDYINTLVSEQVEVDGRKLTVIDQTLKEDMQDHLVSAIMDYKIK